MEIRNGIHDKSHLSGKIIEPMNWLEHSTACLYFLLPLAIFRASYRISLRAAFGRIPVVCTKNAWEASGVLSTLRNRGEGASKSGNVRIAKTMQHAARSNERGACIMYPLVHEGPRYSAQVCAHKRRNFRYLWPGERRNLVGSYFSPMYLFVVPATRAKTGTVARVHPAVRKPLFTVAHGPRRGPGCFAS